MAARKSTATMTFTLKGIVRSFTSIQLRDTRSPLLHSSLRSSLNAATPFHSVYLASMCSALSLSLIIKTPSSPPYMRVKRPTRNKFSFSHGLAICADGARKEVRPSAPMSTSHVATVPSAKRREIGWSSGRWRADGEDEEREEKGQCASEE